MKKMIPCVFFLLNNEIVSCIVLIVYAAMLIAFITKSATERG